MCAAYRCAWLDGGVGGASARPDLSGVIVDTSIPDELAEAVGRPCVAVRVAEWQDLAVEGIAREALLGAGNVVVMFEVEP